MKTIHVLCNKETRTPLEDILNDECTGYWRIDQKNTPLDGVKRVEIWDEETSSKIVGDITEYEYVDRTDDHGPGYVFYFNPRRNVEERTVRSVRWENRPSFNQIGWCIK